MTCSEITGWLHGNANNGRIVPTGLVRVGFPRSNEQAAFKNTKKKKIIWGQEKEGRGLGRGLSNWTALTERTLISEYFYFIVLFCPFFMSYFNDREFLNPSVVRQLLWAQWPCQSERYPVKETNKDVNHHLDYTLLLYNILNNCLFIVWS